ncbi:MAG: DUF1573 domain-containing protein [Verrucomicrobiia bacterium]
MVLFPRPAAAQLIWERSAVHLTSPESRKVVTAEYPFRNMGDKPVTIRRVRTNCGCTAAQLSQRTYLPGESDRVVVAFHIEGRSGFQDKRIRIQTDDPSSDIELRLAVEIVAGLRISPLVLRWPSSQRSVPREAVVRLPPGQSASSLRIVFFPPEIARYELLDTEQVNHKRLVISPLNPSPGRHRATIELGDESLPLHLLFQ